MIPPVLACASCICHLLNLRTAGCCLTSILAHTELSPCTKNANAKDRWLALWGGVVYASGPIPFGLSGSEGSKRGAG